MRAPFLMELRVWWRKHPWKQINGIQHDKYSNREVSSKLSRKWHRKQRDSQPRR